MKKFILLALLFPLITFSQENSDANFIKKISDEMLTNGEAYSQLHYLTKNIGGRLAGSPQYNLATLWGKESLQKAGADTVFLQACEVPHWVRGGKDEAFLINDKTKKRNLNILALGNSLGSGKKGITAEVIAVQSFDELEEKRNEIKGKIVFYNAGFDPANIIPGMSYGQLGRYRRDGASRAAKYGASGVIIRSLTGATDNHPHTGMMVYNDSFPKIPAAALGLEDADWLWKECKHNKKVIVSLFTHGYFLPDTINHNVIAEIKGSEKPETIITVGGHLDSWDVNEGAHDDGAGVVQTIEILRTFKALQFKPKHTIRFVLFANEENGLKGGLKYAEEAKAKNENHLFALESDAGGLTPRGFLFDIAQDKLEKIQPWKDLLIPYGVYFLTQGGGGADISPLHKTFQTPVAQLLPDNQRYFDVHHAKSDVFEAVNKRELLLGAVNMAAFVYLVDKYGL